MEAEEGGGAGRSGSKEGGASSKQQAWGSTAQGKPTSRSQTQEELAADQQQVGIEGRGEGRGAGNDQRTKGNNAGEALVRGHCVVLFPLCWSLGLSLLLWFPPGRLPPERHVCVCVIL